MPKIANAEFVDLLRRLAAAEKYEVVGSIHKEDFIFTYDAEGHTPRTVEQATQVYFTDGHRSAENANRVVEQFLPGRTGLTLLEFASGYGCVTGHLVKENAHFTMTACDIHPKAIDFLMRHIGVDAVLSPPTPEDLPLPQRIDVVFALTFFPIFRRLPLVDG